MAKLLLFLTSIFSYSLHAQESIETKKYAIEVAGIKVGEMHAIKHQLNKDVVKPLNS